MVNGALKPLMINVLAPRNFNFGTGIIPFPTNFGGREKLNCTDLSMVCLKKERLCFQIVLGQTWIEFYCTAIFFCWAQLVRMWIG